MTKSELLRTILRAYLEDVNAREAIAIYKREKRSVQLKILKGALADLM